jgi:anti-anti-sigma factor
VIVACANYFVEKSGSIGHLALGESRMLEVSSTMWDDWRILSIKGEFVVRYLAHVRRHLDQLAEEESPRVALDLTQTSCVDSSAITLMLNYYRRLKARNGDVVLFGAADETKSVFSIVGLEASMTIYDTRAEFEETVRM